MSKPFSQMNRDEQVTKKIHFHCHFCDEMFSFCRSECRVQPNPENVYCCIMPCPKCNRDIETPL